MQPPELDVQMELERLTIKDFSIEQQSMASARMEVVEQTPPESNETRESQKESLDSRGAKKKKIK